MFGRGIHILNLTIGHGSLSSNIDMKVFWQSTRTIFPGETAAVRVDLSLLRSKDSVWENDLLIIRVSQNKRPQSSEHPHQITTVF